MSVLGYEVIGFFRCAASASEAFYLLNLVDGILKEAGSSEELASIFEERGLAHEVARVLRCCNVLGPYCSVSTRLFVGLSHEVEGSFALKVWSGPDASMRSDAPVEHATLALAALMWRLGAVSVDRSCERFV